MRALHANLGPEDVLAFCKSKKVIISKYRNSSKFFKLKLSQE